MPAVFLRTRVMGVKKIRLACGTAGVVLEDTPISGAYERCEEAFNCACRAAYGIALLWYGRPYIWHNPMSYVGPPIP